MDTADNMREKIQAIRKFRKKNTYRLGNVKSLIILDKREEIFK